MRKIKLGAWLHAYRQEHHLSMRDVARACGFSKNYVYILEKGINSTTGRAMTPSVKKLKSIAAMAGIPLEELMAMD